MNRPELLESIVAAARAINGYRPLDGRTVPAASAAWARYDAAVPTATLQRIANELWCIAELARSGQ